MEDTAGLYGALDLLTAGVDALRPRLLTWADEFDRSPHAAARFDPEERRLLVDALERLVLKRILIEPAFAVIARLDVDRSKVLLLRLYLGQGVSADTKFGGYQFELRLLLSELVEVGGAELLADLVRQQSFDRAKLTDPRVLDSVCDALSLDSVDMVQEWLRNARPTT